MTVQISLCQAWSLPAYAQPYIHMMPSVNQTIPVIGNKGQFELDIVPDNVTICWGERGAPLRQLAWTDNDSLDWDGQVQVGGFVTAIHFAYMEQLDMELAIMSVEAYPLKPHVTPYLPAQARDTLPYSPPDFLDGVDDSHSEGVTTWIAEVDSPLVGLMQDAMNQGHRIYTFGQLASEEQGWHHIFALPILLEAVTTFMR